ncbi:glycine cleavage H-protein [Acidimicrobium ferrooxidans DSM 10331]|uniref:Glycine cleavage system H protein n=1 Tax=Acidimicrobium ferrooxidans (strain DSM 10331 / JCM 15462 / NBRC 103882 / ICP) TaxID=525909 RepID=C7LYV4_ACIFD|nr:glycine cleavage system protein GcvH [Acidimicrobium ferrooxidans]ACU53912.1 glycine cleavage H-protein [Acidimicrobium ferrooxidans DSM 10331]
MAEVRSCNLPEDLYYLVDRHVWVRPEGDVLVVGLTDVAQNLAKTIISVSLKPAGKPVKAGRSLATVESGKWVGPVPAPVDGEVVEVNGALATHPGLLNDDPYGEGWVAKLRADAFDPAAAGLVTGDEGIARYSAFLEEQGISCG